ncbi:hypothetical protein [Pasteurella sp. PK-2025]|uniref:hypothetical protein n=1 Tax=unclassified Pasteurella TaxID=2621516 RepID=UPI003C75C1CE
MKKILFALSFILLFACSAKQPIEPVVLDHKTLEEYQHKVLTGDTVPAHQKQAYSTAVESPLNASDYQEKKKTDGVMTRPNVVLVPSVGYHYNRWY